MTPREIWAELSRIAFIGSDRAFLDKSFMEALAEQQIDLDRDIADIVLESAAVYHISHKAGFPLLHIEKPAAVVSDVKSEVITNASVRFLKSILKSNAPVIALEFLQILRHKKKCIPAQHLADLIEDPAFNADFKVLLPFIIDIKGQWLLRYNPDWRYLIDIKNHEVWRNTDKEQRLIMFRLLRQHYPEVATAFLDKSWNEIPSREKKALLSILESGISEPDLPYLQNWFADKDKNISIQVALLLMRIETSDAYQQVLLHTNNDLEISGEKKPALIWKNSFDASIKPEKSQPHHSKPVFLQLLGGKQFSSPISIIRPSYWTEKFNLSPKDLLQLMEARDLSLKNKTDENSVIPALVSAAAFHRDSTWLNLLLSYYWSESKGSNDPDMEIFGIMLNAATFADQDRFLNLVLSDYSEKTSALVSRILLHMTTLPFQWQESHVRVFTKSLSNNSNVGFNYYEMEIFLRHLVIHAIPAVLPSLLDMLENNQFTSGQLNPLAPKLVPMIKWRLQMQELLK